MSRCTKRLRALGRGAPQIGTIAPPLTSLAEACLSDTPRTWLSRDLPTAIADGDADDGCQDKAGYQPWNLSLTWCARTPEAVRLTKAEAIVSRVETGEVGTVIPR